MMTNRHVVEEFMHGEADEKTMTYKPGMATSIDLKEEVGSVESLFLVPTGRAVFSTDLDVAVFEIESLPDSVRPAAMVSTRPTSIDERLAVVVGYPALDPCEPLLEQISIFRGVFDKKRLQPGRLKGLTSVNSYGSEVTALAHDCSTLGG